MAETVSSLLAKSAGYLKDKGSQTSRLDAELLLAEVLGATRVDLYVNFEKPINAAEIDHYRELVRRRAAGEPVAYILGRAYFRNLTLHVDRCVLIPRPETEHVVEAALHILKARDWSRPPRVLDVGTGSGAIAISIAVAFPQARVTAVDASEDALHMAEDNALAAEVGENISFLQSDLFQSIDEMDTFDIVVSNPPYISETEWPALPVDVREYEPREALYGGADGLDFYRRLAEEAPAHIAPGGCLVVEIGYTQGAAVSAMLKETGFFSLVNIEKDYSDHDRVVAACRE